MTTTTNAKTLGPAATKWLEGFNAMKQLLTPKMLASTNADIAQVGAFLAHRLAVELDGRYRIHTHSQATKSRQEKMEKFQEGIDELSFANILEGSDEPMAEETDLPEGSSDGQASETTSPI